MRPARLLCLRLTAAPLVADLAKHFRPRHPGVAIPIARDGVTFAVHRANPVKELTPAQALESLRIPVQEKS